VRAGGAMCSYQDVHLEKLQAVVVDPSPTPDA
jgi:hypothetical protein